MQRPSEASAWANAWRLLAVCVLTGLGSPASDYARTMRVWTDYVNDRPAADQEAILVGNARRFWNLQPA